MQSKALAQQLHLARQGTALLSIGSDILFLHQLGANSGVHIIIFDEIDAICKQRGSMAGSTGVHDTVVNQLLSKIDGVEQLNNILVIGTKMLCFTWDGDLTGISCRYGSSACVWSQLIFQRLQLSDFCMCEIINAEQDGQQLWI